MTTQLERRPIQPLYDATNVVPAYQLRYSWTGWPSKDRFTETPVDLLTDLEAAWQMDGLRLLEQRWSEKQIQLLFSATPTVSPEFLAQRAKGRLDHAIRKAGLQMPFSRKMSVRSIGDNVSSDVKAYIENQVGKAQFANVHFESLMNAYTVVNDFDLSQPSETKRGRYWYNLHIVLGTAERFAIVDERRLATLRDWTLGIASKHGHSISRLAIMPDHLHLALRGNHTHCSCTIVNAFQNNLAYAVGQKRIWQNSYYVGTFSEYNMRAIRRGIDAVSHGNRC